MSSADYYDKYKKQRKRITMEFHNNLAYILRQISNNPTGLFDENLSQEIFQPSDYCRVVETRRENYYRLLYVFLSRNNLEEAGNCLLSIMHDYYGNLSIVWRAAFHILMQNDNHILVESFFKSMLKTTVVDHQCMIYGYFMYLLSIGEYERLRDTYTDPLVQDRQVNSGRTVTDYEVWLVPRYIKMAVATACVLIWQESLSTSREDVYAADQAELYFREIRGLIEGGVAVSNYLTCAVFLLRKRGRLDDCLSLLRYYLDKFPRDLVCLGLLAEIDVDPIAKVNLVEVLLLANSNKLVEQIKEAVSILEEAGDYDRAASLLVRFLGDLDDRDQQSQGHETWAKEALARVTAASGDGRHLLNQ